MNMIELIGKLTIYVDVVTRLLRKLERVYCRGRALIRLITSDVAYENTFLEMVVDIGDPEGHRALFKRRLGVKFLKAEYGIIRELFWGDGQPLASYASRGARKLSLRREGSKSVVLLALDHKPQRGERAVITSRRWLLGAFQERTEYFEAFVERPTSQLSIKILFPKSRPPQEGHVVALPPGRTVGRLPVRYGREGRPFLLWRDPKPNLFTHYSLRWSW